MDDDTAAALARFQHRLANANRLYDRAEALNARALALEAELTGPAADRFLPDEAETLREIARLRDEAAAMDRDGAAIHRSLYKRSPDLEDEVKRWAERATMPASNRER